MNVALTYDHRLIDGREVRRLTCFVLSTCIRYVTRLHLRLDFSACKCHDMRSEANLVSCQCCVGCYIPQASQR